MQGKPLLGNMRISEGGPSHPRRPPLHWETSKTLMGCVCTWLFVPDIWESLSILMSGCYSLRQDRHDRDNSWLGFYLDWPHDPFHCVHISPTFSSVFDTLHILIWSTQHKSRKVKEEPVLTSNNSPFVVKGMISSLMSASSLGKHNKWLLAS